MSAIISHFSTCKLRICALRKIWVGVTHVMPVTPGSSCEIRYVAIQDFRRIISLVEISSALY